MSRDRSDPFRLWSDVALLGIRSYATAMASGLEATARLIPPAAAFPAPAIRRSRPREMWPAAGSFGSNNAVGAWVDATQAMMGVAPRRFGFSFPWVPAAMPWAGMAASGGWPMTMPWAAPFQWPMAGARLPFMPFAATPAFADPFQLMRMMSPMLLPMATTAASSWRYH